MFGYTIIKKVDLAVLESLLDKYRATLRERNAMLHKVTEPTLNCGYKSCQFTTTDPRGLKIHRSRVHKKK
jgi:hypothetical protein